MDLAHLGKVLMLLGAAIALSGGLLVLASKGILPRLPGDLSFESGNVKIYVPLATSIVLSIVLTIVLNLIARH